MTTTANQSDASKANQNGTLKVNIDTHMPSSDNIPKQLQVLGSDLTLKKSSWMSGKTMGQELDPGVYMIRLNLASGKQMEQIVEIMEGQETKLDFDISQFSPRESQEWMYFTKSNSGENPVTSPFRNDSLSQNKKYLKGISARRWLFQNSVWSSLDVPEITNRLIDTIGEAYQLNISPGMQILEVTTPGKLSSFVCLPPGNDLKCMIKIAEGPEEVVPELDISVSISNEKAQSLLSLIASGDMGKAKSLVPAKDAEELLYSKIEAPASAAIGGYYLLKSGELEKLHDWANNLANWFTWMPDGAIIHAWQMIQQGTGNSNITPIRNRFLEAVNRGVPIYSEGLRLLYEGLTMLSFELKKEDTAIEMALKRIKAYMNAADLSQETTTYVGTYPDQPGFDNKSAGNSGMKRPVERIK